MDLIKDVLIVLSTPEAGAFIWFVCCWVGYTYYSESNATRRPCLSNTLHRHREIWMSNMLMRDNRVADAALLANLERNVAFFASTSIIIIAGTLTLFGSIDRLDNVPFIDAELQKTWAEKLLMLAGIFVYAFFKFTWSLRQYGFACVMVGSAPINVGEGNLIGGGVFYRDSALVISRAAHAFNLGLRSYYFALAFIVWFVSGWGFVCASALVVCVLYRREFKSKVLKALIRSNAENGS